MVGWTFLGHIFVKRGHESCIPHERIHVAQQSRDGWRFYVRYVFSAKWRVRYEAEAYRADIAAGRTSADVAARALSGPLYLWPCSYDAAVKALTAATAA